MPDGDLGDARTDAFPAGSKVAIVEVLDGKVWTWRPVTVVCDEPDEIALWRAPGTLTRYPAGPQHGEHTVGRWLTGSWELTDKTWGPPGKLRLSRPGDPSTSGCHPDQPPAPPNPGTSTSQIGRPGRWRCRLAGR